MILGLIILSYYYCSCISLDNKTEFVRRLVCINTCKSIRNYKILNFSKKTFTLTNFFKIFRNLFTCMYLYTNKYTLNECLTLSNDNNRRSEDWGPFYIFNFINQIFLSRTERQRTEPFRCLHVHEGSREVNGYLT